jgi:hypothetical protein
MSHSIEANTRAERKARSLCDSIISESNPEAYQDRLNKFLNKQGIDAKGSYDTQTVIDAMRKV